MSFVMLFTARTTTFLYLVLRAITCEVCSTRHVTSPEMPDASSSVQTAPLLHYKSAILCNSMQFYAMSVDSAAEDES